MINWAGSLFRFYTTLLLAGEIHFITTDEYILLHARAQLLSGIRNRRRTFLPFLLSINTSLLQSGLTYFTLLGGHHYFRQPLRSIITISLSVYDFKALFFSPLTRRQCITKSNIVRSLFHVRTKKKGPSGPMGGVLFFGGLYFHKEGRVFNLFTKAYTISATSGVRRGSGIRVES